MDTGENDKDTIVASGSDSENGQKSRHSRKFKKHKRSRHSSSSDRYRNNYRRRSIDSNDRDKYYELKYKNRNKDYDQRRRGNSRDNHDNKSDRKDARKRRSRTRSRDRYTRRSKSYDRRERSISKSKTNNEPKSTAIDVKKKYEEIIKQSNFQVPFSTTDIHKRDYEMFVGNLPEGLTPSDVKELMNAAMIAISANVKSGNPIVSTWMSQEGNFAFMEFRYPEEARNATKLDGLSLLGKEIKVGRPRYQDEVQGGQDNSKDLFPTLTIFEKEISNPSLKASLTSYIKASTSLSTLTPMSSKLLLSNLPLNFDEESIYKFIRTFGKVKYLEMINDPVTGQFSGQCHLEYDTEIATSNALQYMMGINLQGNILYIKRSTGLLPIYSNSSSLGLISASTNSNQLQQDNPEDYIKLRECTPSKVIMIKNMCTMKELEDDNEYEDLYDDVLEECKNYGKVISVKIPRMDGSHNVQGLGKVFVEYYTRDGAAFAREHLHDKCFHGRFVEVVFHPEDMFRKNQLD